MGGIQATSIGVECDRCKKVNNVAEDKQVAFYKEWAEREDTDDRMLVAVINGPGGEKVTVDFEYLCPKCTDSVLGYLFKIDTDQAPKKKGKGGKDDKPAGDDKPPTEPEGSKDDKDSPAQPTQSSEPNDGGEEEPATEPPADEPSVKGEPEGGDDEEPKSEDGEGGDAGADFAEDDLFD